MGRSPSTVDLTIRNAKVYVSGTLIEGGIAVEDGRIVRIAKNANLPRACREIRLRDGQILIPGPIDVHVHLRDQGLAYKEDFVSGTMAAAAGGITLVIDMPNNEPVTMDPAGLRERMRRARGRILVDVAFYSAFPGRIEDIQPIVEAGAVAFKLFLSKRVGGVDIEDDNQIRKALQEAGRARVPVAVHAEDKGMLEKLEAEMRRVGRGDVEAFLEVHRPEVEAIAVQRITNLADGLGTRIHLCHISSRLGLEAVSRGRRMGVPITCEVTPHHLLLSRECYGRHSTMAVTTPPIRGGVDQEALLEGLREGRIDVVASDHAPHTPEEKGIRGRRRSVWEVMPGFPGLETTLPLMLTLVNRGFLRLGDVVRLMAENPAKIFNLTGFGCLEEGAHANFVVLDMRWEGRIDSSSFYSRAKYSPFDGWRVKGRPVKTFVNGRLVMDGGEVVASPGAGRIIGG